MKFKFSLYLRNRLYFALFGLVSIFVFSFAFNWLFPVAQIALSMLGLLSLLDVGLLYYNTKGMEGDRILSEKFSNGDLNEVQLALVNKYSFEVFVEIIDEIPTQFQKRDLLFDTKLSPSQKKNITYQLRPTERGEYYFGVINVFVRTGLGLITRRFCLSKPQKIAVYPSFLQMRQYEFLAISNRLTEIGIKKIRKIGHNMEFEQVKEYVRGDDVRSINWKATARRVNLMVNQYQDEKSQAIYCLIDKGRSMKMPFEGLSLLDYAINASLVLLNIALLKQDKAGLLMFDHEIGARLSARGTAAQRQSILELLYRERTRFTESDFSQLAIQVRTQIKQRSLLILFTNFEAESSLSRQLPYLRQMARHHLILLVIFENTELNQLLHQPTNNTEDIYIQTIAEDFAHEKKMIVKELNRFGIHTLLTSPQNLTVGTLNKYLEFKSRGLI